MTDHSFVEGRVVTTKRDPLPTLDSLLLEILDCALSAGRCILIGARNSSEGGVQAYDAAVTDFG